MRFAMAGALAFLTASGGSALADCNKPLQMVASVDFVAGPDNREIRLPVTINGQQRYMIADTGASVSSLTDAAVDSLGLKRAIGNVIMTDVSGDQSREYVHTSLTIGLIHGDNLGFSVWHGVSLGDDPNLVGLLGHDIMLRYDVDIDFANRKFNFLDPDHCDGKVIYWPATAVAVVPFTLMDDGDIQLDVQLDGETVTAILDTGAWNTTLSIEKAESPFGLKLGSADTPQTGTLPKAAKAYTYRHVFKTMAFEGITVSNPVIDIIPDMFHNANLSDSEPLTGSLISNHSRNSANQSMLLGMNIMRHFHFYIAYKERKLYITPASPPPAAPATSGAPSVAPTQAH